MKIALLLLLAGCASAPKPLPVKTFQCNILNREGSLVRMKLDRQTMDQAYDDATKVWKRLVEKKLVSDTSYVDCLELDGNQK